MGKGRISNYPPHHQKKILSEIWFTKLTSFSNQVYRSSDRNSLSNIFSHRLLSIFIFLFLVFLHFPTIGQKAYKYTCFSRSALCNGNHRMICNMKAVVAINYYLVVVHMYAVVNLISICTQWWETIHI